MLTRDPLRDPLGRTDDRNVDEALARHGMDRTELFRSGRTLAPHRQRIAAMLAAHQLSVRQIVARYWPELKRADHLCAHCVDKKRCDRWLRGHSVGDAPRRFCPNAATFERWRRESLESDEADDGSDGDRVLTSGLAQTRELLERLRRR